MRTLRPYQEEAIAAAKRDLEKYSSTILVLPTGCGKTVVMAKFAAEWDDNVLLLAHRKELLDQAADKLGAELGYRPAIEQATRTVEEGCLHMGGMVIVGSMQSMTGKKRLRKYAGMKFGLIMIDECHHATAMSYRRIIDHFMATNPNMKVLGVTATPRRSDNTAMGTIFRSAAYQYPIVNAIDDGWLVPIRQEVVTIEGVDFSGIKCTTNDLGESDFSGADLESILTEEEPLHAVARPLLDKAGGRPTLVFTAGVAHAHLLAAIFNREKSGSAAAVDGETLPPKREQIVRDFSEGRIQFLCNCDVFTEGFDVPPVAVIGMARPTRSVLKYTQMLGRGMRPLDGIVDGYGCAEDRKMSILTSAKPFVSVIDFVGVSEHKLVNSADVLGGNYDLEAIKEAKEALKAKPGADVLKEINMAKAMMLLEREQRARQAIRANVNYMTEEVDPFGGYSPGIVRQNIASTRGGSSDAQIELLVKLGVDQRTASGYTKKQASAVIEDLKSKRCTDKQARTLRNNGIDPDGLNFDAASKLLDELFKKKGWKTNWQKGDGNERADEAG